MASAASLRCVTARGGESRARAVAVRIGGSLVRPRRFLASKRACVPSRSGGDGTRDESTPGEGAGNVPRRTLQVAFTCNKCNSRSERLVNPLAWQKGTVFVQCAACGAWHKLRDNLNIIDEIRYLDEESENQ